MIDEETARKFEFMPQQAAGQPGGGDFMNQLKSMGVMGSDGVPDVGVNKSLDDQAEGTDEQN
jgi:hypothetical protein